MSNNSNKVSDSGQNMPTWRTDRSVPVPTPGRATRVASWIGWHLPELAGVTAPAVAAVAVSPWALLASGVVGAGWRVHTVRSARELAALNAGRDRSADEVAGAEVIDIADGPAIDPADSDGTGDVGTASVADGNGGRDARGLA